jgi:hypothetical protein
MSNSSNTKIAVESRKTLTRLLWSCLKRGMFAQNVHGNWEDPRVAKWKMPDFLPPDLWAIFARGYMKTWLAPVLCPFVAACDVFQLISVLFKVFGPKNEDATFKFTMPGPNDVDDMNINNTIIVNQKFYQTPFSWIARKVYSRFRRPNNGNFILGEKSNVLGAIAWNNHNDNPEFTDLYRVLVERY